MEENELPSLLQIKLVTLIFSGKNIAYYNLQFFDFKLLALY